MIFSVSSEGSILIFWGDRKKDKSRIFLAVSEDACFPVILLSEYVHNAACPVLRILLVVFVVLFAAERDAATWGFYLDIMHEKCADRLFGYFGEILTVVFLSNQPREKISRLGTCFICQ